VSSSQLTRNACWGWAHTRSRHGHAIDHPLADQADIAHSQTYLACEHRGTVHAQADLAVDQQNCLSTAYSEQWLEYVTEERRSSTPGPPVGSLWPIGRHPMPEHLGRIKQVTKHPGPQLNSIIGPSHIATRASAAISFLSNPGGVLTTDASSHPAETTNLRKLRCPVTRRGFDVV